MKINVNQRRYEVCAALAASALPALLMGRGHRVDNVPEFLLVLSDSVNRMAVLERVGALVDVIIAAQSRQVRCGAGKTRNRLYTQRKGPLLVYDISEVLDKAFRNLPGVDLANVTICHFWSWHQVATWEDSSCGRKVIGLPLWHV